MRLGLLLLGIAVATAGASAPALADSCNLTRVAAMEMNFDEGGGPYVAMSISGQNVNMLIDTGGIFSLLTEQSVQILGLQKHPAFGSQVGVFGGYKITSYVEANDVNLGGLRAERMPLQVIPDSIAATGIGGTLSPNILSHYDVDFDFGGGKFNLFSPDHCPGKVVYWTADAFASIPFTMDPVGHMQVPVTLDGTSLQAIVDTGSTYSIIGLSLAKSLFGIDDKSLTTVHMKRGTWFRYHFSKMELGPVNITEPEIFLVPDEYSKTPVGDRVFLIGMSTLKQLHMYIAYKERTMFVTPAASR